MTRAMRFRTSRYAFRASGRKTAVSAKRAGMAANATRASRQSSHSITTTAPPTARTSPRIDTTPEVNSSPIASTSLRMRVIRRPTGVRSKNRAGSRWTWAKSACRRSWITRWPVPARR